MRFIITLLIAFTMLVPSVQAQDYGRMFEDVSELNIGDPLRNSRFDRLEKILKRKVQDKKHKVVGEVKNLLVDDRGAIEAIEIDFNRLRLSTSVSLDYQTSGISGVSNAYVLELYDDKQIEDLFPTFLANMQTAAGDEDIMSVERIIGATVKSDNGRVLGKVNDILFDNSGDRARALYVDMKEGKYRGTNIAIPFDNVEYDLNNKRKEIILSQQQAQAVLDYVESN